MSQNGTIWQHNAEQQPQELRPTAPSWLPPPRPPMGGPAMMMRGTPQPPAEATVATGYSNDGAVAWGVSCNNNTSWPPLGSANGAQQQQQQPPPPSWNPQQQPPTAAMLDSSASSWNPYHPPHSAPAGRRSSRVLPAWMTHPASTITSDPVPPPPPPQHWSNSTLSAAGTGGSVAQWNQQPQSASFPNDAIPHPPQQQPGMPFPLVPLPPLSPAEIHSNNMSWQQQQQQQQQRKGPPPPLLLPHAPTYAGVVAGNNASSRWGPQRSERAGVELGFGGVGEDDPQAAAPTNGRKRQPPVAEKNTQQQQPPKKAKKEPPASHNNKNGETQQELGKKGAKPLKRKKASNTRRKQRQNQASNNSRRNKRRKLREDASRSTGDALAQALLGGHNTAAAADNDEGIVTGFSRHNEGEAPASSRPLSKTLPKSVLPGLPLLRQDETIEEQLSSLTDDLDLALRNSDDPVARTRMIRERRDRIRECHQRPRTRPLFPTERERRTARALKQAATALGEEEPVVDAAVTGSSQDDNKSQTEAVSVAAADGGERRDDKQSATASRSSEPEVVSAKTTSNGTGLLNNIADNPSGKEAVAIVAVENGGGGKTNTALSEARAKLRKAMLAKKRALEEQLAAQTRQVAPDPLRPINALLKGGLDSLRITQIRTSGPAEKVYFAETALLDADENLSGTTGEDAAAAAAAAADNNGEGTARASNKNLAESLALTARKVQLQQRLVEAKEKRQRLEEAAVAAQQHRPQSPRTGGGPTDVPETGGVQQNEGTAKLDQRCVVQGGGLAASSAAEQTQRPTSKTLTREELLKRKEEAQRTNAVSHLRHILLKQERLKAEQASDMQQTAANLASCETDLRASKKQLEETKRNIQTLAARKEVLEGLTAKHVSELVKKRKSLHDYKLMKQQELSEQS